METSTKTAEPGVEQAKDIELQDGSKLEKAKDDARSEKQEQQYPPFKIVLPIVVAIYFAFFLAALDRTIVGVAVPAISDDFRSFDDISWYESAFLLTSCVCQLPMGKIYKYFSPKWTFVATVVIFEIGSIVCAAAPTSPAFIVGRAITGIGAAGILVGAQVIVRGLVPLEKIPKYQGLLGACFGLASIMGPLAGGAFTSNISWRWCFWISVPIGGVSLVVFVFILPASLPLEKLQGTPFEIVKKFDPIGNLLLAPGVICLLLGLQWGGSTYPWSSSRIIALLVVGSVLLAAFAAVQAWVQENGTIPPRIFRQRSIAAGTIVSLGLGSVLIITTFYLPIWFQAVQGISAGKAGVRLLPYFLSTVAFVIASGVDISKVGYYTPWLIAGTAISIIGVALLTTLRLGTTTGQWVGYEILVGAGFGLSLQQVYNAAQTVLATQDVPAGITLLAFSQSLGGTVFVSVAQTILSHTLRSQLARTLPGFDASSISSTGATDIRNLVSEDDLQIVLLAYNAGIDNVFYCALALSGLAFVAALFVEWKSVKSADGKSDTTAI